MKISILSLALAATALANREESSFGRNNNSNLPRLQPRGEEAIEENQQPQMQKDGFLGGFGGLQGPNNAFIQHQPFQQPGGFPNRGPQGFQGGNGGFGGPQGGNFWRQGQHSPRFQNFNVKSEDIHKDIDIKDKAIGRDETNQWGGGWGGWGGGCCNPCGFGWGGCGGWGFW